MKLAVVLVFVASVFAFGVSALPSGRDAGANSLSPIGRLQTEAAEAAAASAEALPRRTTGAAPRPSTTPVPRPSPSPSVAPRSAPTTTRSSSTSTSSAAGCWVGQVNHCTGESREWSGVTRAAQATPSIVQASLMAAPGLQLPAALTTRGNANVGFAFVEADAEAQNRCSGTCQAPNSRCATRFQTGLCPGSSVCCVAASSSSTVAPRPASPPAQGRCSGSCQAVNSRCATRFQTGLCPGSTVCCVAASSSGTVPATAPTTPAADAGSLTGVSSRILDPQEDIIRRSRTITWAMLTSAQQTNARLLMRYAKQQQITDINALAYIFGTAHWECHLTPIKEWGGSSMRYAPYFGRGFVQLTWRDNYRKMTEKLQSEAGITANLVRTPDLALNPTNAAFIAAYGMKHGTFTTRRLDQYFGNGKADFVGARAIINGRDKAQTIATLSRLWVPLTRTLFAQP